ncbi:hypothetical protein Tco_1008620 [Tanacetum coccineum]
MFDEMSLNKFLTKHGTVKEYFDSFNSWFSKGNLVKKMSMVTNKFASEKYEIEDKNKIMGLSSLVYGSEQDGSKEDNDLIISDLVLRKCFDERYFEGQVGRYKSFNVFAYDSDVHNPSTKVVTCEDELYMDERKTENSEIGHLYGLPRLMGQLGLCLPMAQAAMQNNKVSESGSAAKKVELKVYTCDINLDDSLKPILQDPIALDTDASSGKKPTYKQIIILSSIRLVIAATMNFGFQRDLEEDDSSMCGLLHNSNRHIPISICLYEKVGGNKNKGLKLSRSPSAVCSPPVSSSTKRAKNGNERRLSTLGLGDVEVWFSDDELGVAST